jgi:F-type H+-transporting ATPase subunit epsilon
MADLIRLEIATPQRMLINELVTEATIPGEEGYLGILPGHAPLLSELGKGELMYSLPSGQKRYVAVHGGYVEISGGHIRVLADNAENANEIDVVRAERALKRAMERVAKAEGVDIARALNAMKRAKARLEAAKYAGAPMR